MYLILSIHYLVLLDIICVNLPAKILLKMFGLLSKLLASLMKNNFPKRAWGAPFHTLSILYYVPVGFVIPPHFRQCMTSFAVAEGLLLFDITLFVLFLNIPLSVNGNIHLNTYFLAKSDDGLFHIANFPFLSG